MTLTNFPNGISSFGVPVLGSGPFEPFGRFWFVDTTTGNGDGTAPDSAFLTMTQAMAVVGDNDVICFKGKIREQIVAPLGVTGVTILGCVGGNVRDDDGAKWYAPATPVAGKALLELREQGWVLQNFLMSPDTTSGACVKAHRAEDATYPDSSHFICRNMRFVGTSLTTTYGIQDVGGNHHYIIDNCEFQTLTTAIYCSSTAIAVPLRNTITNCKFLANTNDINSAQSYALIQNNRFFTDSTATVVIAGGGNCMVTGNVFPNGQADIDPAHGYDGNSTDVWTGNLVTDQAAYVYGDPA